MLQSPQIPKNGDLCASRERSVPDTQSSAIGQVVIGMERWVRRWLDLRMRVSLRQLHVTAEPSGHPSFCWVLAGIGSFGLQ